jgi:hypothetical protein
MASPLISYSPGSGPSTGVSSMQPIPGKNIFFEKVLDKCVIIIYVQMNIIYYA